MATNPFTPELILGIVDDYVTPTLQAIREDMLLQNARRHEALMRSFDLVTLLAERNPDLALNVMRDAHLSDNDTLIRMLDSLGNTYVDGLRVATQAMNASSTTVRVGPSETPPEEEEEEEIFSEIDHVFGEHDGNVEGCSFCASEAAVMDTDLDDCLVVEEDEALEDDLVDEVFDEALEGEYLDPLGEEPDDFLTIYALDEMDGYDILQLLVIDLSDEPEEDDWY